VIVLKVIKQNSDYSVYSRNTKMLERWNNLVFYVISDIYLQFISLFICDTSKIVEASRFKIATLTA